MKKLRLDADRVEVESFPTAQEPPPASGTVHAEACTYAQTCLCPSAYYWCGDGYQTLYSCDYSKADPCPTSIYEC